MKTTVEIADALMEEAKEIAARDGVTFRVLIEAGLRQEIEKRKRPKRRRKMRDGSYGKGGMLKPYTWDEIKDIIYEGHGS